MSHEILIQLDELLDQCEHTFICLTENLAQGIKCKCGVQEMQEAMIKYRSNIWKEKRSG